MNVLLICHTLGYGGVERQVLLLAAGLRAEGHGVLFAGPRESWLTRHCVREGVPCVHVPLRGLGDPRSHFRLFRIAHRFDAHILHGHTLRSAFYSAVAARLARRRSVCTVHSLNTWKRFGLNDRVIVVSQAVREFLLTKGIPANKIAVVYNGVPQPPNSVFVGRTETRRRLGLEDHDVAIGMATRMVPHKGHDVLIGALERLAARFPHVHVFIAGDASGPWSDRLRTQVATARLEGRVHFLGYQEDVFAILAAMDVLAAPSGTEALPIAILEAFAVGLPVVASRVGGIPELVEHERTGLLCSPGDADDLAAKLERLITDVATREVLGANARQLQRENFSVEAMVQGTSAVYSGLLEHGTP